MQFRILGCSGSELERYHPCSFQIGDSILVDMGSAASRLTLREQASIRHILLSHAHLDHTKDLAFFSENVFGQKVSKVQVWATEETAKKVQTHLMNNQIWPDFSVLPDKENPIVQFKTFEERKNFSLEGVEVFTVPVNHPGGCVAFFFSTPEGTIVYSGDTGPTEELWKEINSRGDEIRAILLETSFPNRLQELATVSGHHTPKTLAGELAKIKALEVPVYLYHLKAPYSDEIMNEINALGDDRLRLIEPGMILEL